LAAVPSFPDLFGASPAVRAAAPGRVNVIGEHTDYSGGFVLPAAIPQETRVEAGPGEDGIVEVWSRDIRPGGERRRYARGAEAPRRDWMDYIQGITHVLAREGHRLGGVRLRIESEVPLGSGVSSSAALQIGVLRALRELFALPLGDVDLAMASHRVETGFVGAPVGIMDQMACSLADRSHVLFLDTRTRAHERLPFPAGTGLIVIDSGVAHSHAAGEYRVRRAECDRAAALLGIAELRDAPPDLDRLARLPPPLDRRARHVVTENARVLAAVAAFRAQDPAAAGVLLSQSHASMRDDFEISVAEVDLLVRLAEQHAGVFGARLTGGGFGGAIVALAALDHARRIAEAVASDYTGRTGLPARILVPEPPG
jgi:galactokinase